MRNAFDAAHIGDHAACRHAGIQSQGNQRGHRTDGHREDDQIRILHRQREISGGIGDADLERNIHGFRLARPEADVLRRIVQCSQC